MTTVEALKDLYVALGGELADVQDMSTNVAVLNAISAKYSGASDAVLNPEAVANIAAVADQIGGGGGESDFSTAQVTIVNPPILVKLPVLVNDTETNMTGIACEYALKEDENTITVALYKGHCYYIRTNVQDVSGNIQYNETLQLYDITGDCTITFPGMG